MKVVFIAAGRGQRIMPFSEKHPKCFTEVDGRRIIDRTLGSLREAGLSEFHFIGGYLVDVVKREYPEFVFHLNHDWSNNNILESLLCAENALKAGFVSTYSDILYTPSIVKKLVDNQHDIVLGVDTDWRTHYAPRTLHPMNDAEKVLLSGERIERVSRDIANDVAPAEFIGVAKFSPRGAAQLIAAYHEARQLFWDNFYGVPFRKAYLIHLFQYMLEKGIDLHFEATHGNYFEIDTVQDLQLASAALQLKQTALY